MQYLNSKNLTDFNFNRSDVGCGAYGGKSNDADKIVNRPIIFIHGNSDVGFGRGTVDGQETWQTGFRSLANYFVSKGYKKSELYVTTWGTANSKNASDNYHSKNNVLRVRAFIEAVINYTGTSQVNIIGHSMGVTLGRKAIKGGNATDHLNK